MTAVHEFAHVLRIFPADGKRLPVNACICRPLIVNVSALLVLVTVMVIVAPVVATLMDAAVIFLHAV
jgi:hypothetical protein